MDNNLVVGTSLLACVVYLCITYLYIPHRQLKTNTVFDFQRPMPSYLYLWARFKVQGVRKKQGHLYEKKDYEDKLVFTVYNCRYEVKSLRRYCSAFGYGWDYPDGVFRDIPLCYPDFLCSRLIMIILCSDRFKISPFGLSRVRQTIRAFQPVDEVKRGPFILQARVEQYRQVTEGVEVDIALSASRDDQPIWESIITLLSRKTTGLSNEQPVARIQDESDETKAVEIMVSWSTGVKCARALCDFSPKHVFNLLAKPLGYNRQDVPGLWMLSSCLAEIEKHKGVDAVKAPVSVSAHFIQPPPTPGKVTIRFDNRVSDTALSRGCRFQMKECHTGAPYLSGVMQGT